MVQSKPKPEVNMSQNQSRAVVAGGMSSASWVPPWPRLGLAVCMLHCSCLAVPHASYAVHHLDCNTN